MSEKASVQAAATEGALGKRIIALATKLAEWSETPDGLTCTYLTPTHHAVAAELQTWMRNASLATHIDGVGNVIGRYTAADPAAKALIVASHYDTVRHAGNYDGRLGILTCLVALEEIGKNGLKFPFHVDLIAFSEEEGVRFSAPYIGSSAIAGRFDRRFLQLRDSNGQTLGDLIFKTGFDPETLASLARNPNDIAGYLEVHIEQGPVLLRENLPVGIVTGIAGAVRYEVSVTGAAGHAGTVPMGLRCDAGAAAAEMILFVEQRCAQAPTLVGTVGRITVPGGAINVIPGRCEFSLDIRAGDDATVGAAVTDVRAECDRIARRRNVAVIFTEVQRHQAVPCSAHMQAQLACAVTRAGITPRYLPSGAGHDAAVFGRVTDMGMLFVRCGNGGISHSPLETVTAQDADIAARILIDAIVNFAPARRASC